MILIAQHVLIWEDGEKDSINTYIKSPAVVIHFHRDDFSYSNTTRRS